MSEYVFIEPNRTKGRGARQRTALFLLLDQSNTDGSVVKGDVVDESGYIQARGWSLERALCRTVTRATKVNGYLVVANNKLGR